MPKQPNILAYDHYRPFLKDFYVWKKTKDPQLSYRSLAKKAGVSHAHLQAIINDKRDLSPELAVKYQSFLKFSTPRQKQHFLLLTELNCRHKISFEDIVSSTSAQRAMEAILITLVKSRHFKSDPGWISKATCGVFSKQKAKLLLSKMFKEGKLALKEGRVVPANPRISAEGKRGDLDPVRALHMELFHKAEYQQQIWLLDISTAEEFQETLHAFRRYWMGKRKKSSSNKEGRLSGLFITGFQNELAD